MLGDYSTAEKVYLRQRRQLNNTKVHITFQENQDYLGQIDNLFQCLEFGDYKKEINLLNMFQEDDDDDEENYQTEEPIIIDESKTGKTIHALRLDAPKECLSNNYLSKLTNFTKFCPNLVSLHINLDYSGIIRDQNIFDLWINILSHLDKLREIQFEMQYHIMESKRILEIVKYGCSINNLFSLKLSFDFSTLNLEDWKTVYSQLNKLQKLNTLILTSPYTYKTVNPTEQQFVNRLNKKLVRLVNKNISIIFFDN